MGLDCTFVAPSVLLKDRRRPQSHYQEVLRPQNLVGEVRALVVRLLLVGQGLPELPHLRRVDVEELPQVLDAVLGHYWVVLLPYGGRDASKREIGGI